DAGDHRHPLGLAAERNDRALAAVGQQPVLRRANQRAEQRATVDLLRVEQVRVLLRGGQCDADELVLGDVRGQRHLQLLAECRLRQRLPEDLDRAGGALGELGGHYAALQRFWMSVTAWSEGLPSHPSVVTRMNAQ